MDERIRKSRRQEKEGMQRRGGVVQPRSGAGPTRKEDGRTTINGPWPALVQFKRTDNLRSIRIETAALQDLELHAIGEARHPELHFELAKRNYVVLTDEDYSELRSAYERQDFRGPT